MTLKDINEMSGCLFDKAKTEILAFAWNEARRTDPVKRQMLEALKNIENDDEHLPPAIWAEIQNAIKAAEES